MLADKLDEKPLVSAESVKAHTVSNHCTCTLDGLSSFGMAVNNAHPLEPDVVHSPQYIVKVGKEMDNKENESTGRNRAELFLKEIPSLYIPVPTSKKGHTLDALNDLHTELGSFTWIFDDQMIKHDLVVSSNSSLQEKVDICDRCIIDSRDDEYVEQLDSKKKIRNLVRDGHFLTHEQALEESTQRYKEDSLQFDQIKGYDVCTGHEVSGMAAVLSLQCNEHSRKQGHCPRTEQYTGTERKTIHYSSEDTIVLQTCHNPAVLDSKCIPILLASSQNHPGKDGNIKCHWQYNNNSEDISQEEKVFLQKFFPVMSEAVKAPLLHEPTANSLSICEVPEEPSESPETAKKLSSNLKNWVKNALPVSREIAATRIQCNWREYFHRKSKKMEEWRRSEALKSQAVRLIQISWRNLVKRRKERDESKNKLSERMEELYNMVKKRHINNGIVPPTFERFVKLVERIQAATQGARIRRRLKSWRLKEILKEIKEIRIFLEAVSQESGNDASVNLVSQTNRHLKQKLLEVDNTLNGTYVAVWFLPKRLRLSPRPVSAPAKHSQSMQTLSVRKSKTSVSCQLHMNQTFDVLQNAKNKSLTIPGDEGVSIAETKTGIKINVSAGDSVKVNAISQDGSVARGPEHTKIGNAVPGETRPRTIKGLFAPSLQNKCTSTDLNNAEPLVIEVPKSSYLRHSSRQTVQTGLGKPREPKRIVGSKTLRIAASLNDLDANASTCSLKYPYLKRKSLVMQPQKLDWSKVNDSNTKAHGSSCENTKRCSLENSTCYLGAKKEDGKRDCVCEPDFEAAIAKEDHCKPNTASAKNRESRNYNNSSEMRGGETRQQMGKKLACKPPSLPDLESQLCSVRSYLLEPEVTQSKQLCKEEMYGLDQRSTKKLVYRENKNKTISEQQMGTVEGSSVTGPQVFSTDRCSRSSHSSRYITSKLAASK